MHNFFFLIFIDSTTDISHVDQLSIIVKYVSKERCPVERFVRFILNCGHETVDLTNVVVETLKNYNSRIERPVLSHRTLRI